MRPISQSVAVLCAIALPGLAMAAAPQMNQTGFMPDSVKIAVVPNGAKAPVAWSLKDSTGATVATGQTTVFGLNAASGQHVHQADLSGTTGPGTGYVLEIDNEASVPFDIRPDVYRSLKYDALAFFYHQRASVPIEARFVGERWARPAAHELEVVTCWGPKDHRGNDWGGCPYRLDVSKGWYDAGDHGKYVVNGGISVWTLMNAYESDQASAEAAFGDGKVKIPEAGNGVNDLLDEVRFEMDFMLSMQVPDGQSLTLPLGDQRKAAKLIFTRVDASGMAHHKMADEHWTAVPMPPHLDTEKRGLSYPSTAATLNLAATAAQCARLFRTVDPAYADRCLIAAKTAYAAAKRVPDAYAIDVLPGGSGGYGDGNVSDEFYWAAAELYLTTGEAVYEQDLKASPHFLAAPKGDPQGTGDISWGSVQALGTISLATGPDTAFKADARTAIVTSGRAYAAQTAGQGYHIAFDRSYRWGSTSDFSNRGMILGLASDFSGDLALRSEVVHLMDYLLGRNPLSFSYVAGYGERAMAHPHHRFWANTDGLPPPPPGAISGGSNARPTEDLGTCLPQTCYIDDIKSYSTNEVAINWNAPLFWVANWLESQ